MLFSQITPPSSSLSPKVCSLCLCPLTMFLSSVLKVKHISQIFYYYTFFFWHLVFKLCDLFVVQYQM